MLSHPTTEIILQSSSGFMDKEDMPAGYPPRARSVLHMHTNSLKAEPVLQVSMPPRCHTVGIVEYFHSSGLSPTQADVLPMHQIAQTFV